MNDLGHCALPSLNDTRWPVAADDLPAPALPDADAHWALFLDVDGTLLRFTDNPDNSEVPAATLKTVVALHDALEGALALVSGRTIDDLDRLFAGYGFATAGLHGLQRRGDDGKRDDVAVDRDLIGKLRQRVESLVATLPGVRLEDKGPCIALHCREATGHEPALRRGAREIAAALPGYTLQPGNHVYELKPEGMDKGQAVAAFIREAPFAGRTPVYLGDDLTDEHGFAVANAQHGISVRVGQRQPSAARFTLRNPAVVQTWLDNVLARLNNNRSR